MPRFNHHLLTKKQKQEMLEQFYEALSAAKNKREIKAVCQDLFSESEMVMFVRRIQAAILLRKGWSIREIYRKLSASFNQIHQVKFSLQENGTGYDLIIKHFKKKLIGEQKTQEPKPPRLAYWTMTYWLRL